jgi:TonB-linked SusC/RagA family outer membrane protein
MLILIVSNTYYFNFKFFLTTSLIANMSYKINPRKKSIYLFLSFFLLMVSFLPLHLFAQSKTVTGKVTGDDGAPISGVTIQQKGSSTGTATDASGNFSLSVTGPDAILVISSLGYDSKTVSVSGRSNISIKLVSSAAKELEQVVVIGYGTANKRDLTGSIVKVSGKEVADKPNTNPIASLQSKVAGLSVVNNGTPGQAPDIRIRGTVSIGQVHPLYVVDGVFEDNIDYLNPNDIESIEILKDPSSLAIFGVKGATGAIVITTKQAKAGQTIINFNTTYGYKQLVDKIKMVDANGFKTLFAEENANNGVATPDYSALTGNTDWINAVTRIGAYNTNNLSVQSGSDKNRVNFGLGYTMDQGIILHEQLDRLTLSLDDQLKVGKHITVGASIIATRQKDPYDATNILNEARQVIPQVSAGTKSFRVPNPYGTDTVTENLYSGLDVALQNSGVVNPVLELQNTWNKTIQIEYREVGNVYAEVNFLKHFNFRSTFYADISNINERQYTPLYYAYNPLNDEPYLYTSTTSVSETDRDYRKFQQDHVLTFKNSFGEHHLTLTGGFTTYYFGNFNRYATSKQQSGATGVPIPNDPRFWYVTNGFSDQSTALATSDQSEYSTASFLARALYNYQDKYFLNASFRNDASSQIAPKNRNQQFWAIGTAWDISRENFMAHQNIFNYLKIKGSVGVLGNQTASYTDGTPINYPAYPLISNNASNSSAIFGTNIYNASTPSYTANKDLKWETLNEWEAGVELNALNNRLHFEGTYFNKVTKNLMTYISNASLGVPDELINGGSIRNWGEELAATWNQNLSKDWTLNIGGNITFLKNEVLSVAPEVPNQILDITQANNGEAISEFKKGMPIGYFKGYIVTGVYQSYADILKSPSESSLGTIRPGDLKYKDVNGDGQINASDRTYIGNPTPKFTYGFSINFTYKRFNLSSDFGGVYGNQVYRLWGALESPFQRVNYPAFDLNRWHGPGTSNWVPILSQGDRSNYSGSTYSIEDGSYFRIRNLQLGYNFLTKHNSPIKNLRVFANCQNLKTFKNNSGYSPEFGGNAISFGYDNGGGAIPVVTTFGLNVSF